MVNERVLASLQVAQLGLITRAQAFSAGISPPGITRRLASGRWRRVCAGVYAAGAVAPSHAQTVLAAVLGAGGLSVASHRTAAKLHGLAMAPPDLIDLATLADRRVAIEGVRHHRWKAMPAGDITIVAGAVPCTTVARTILDSVKLMPGWRLSGTIDDARRRGLVSTAQVQEVQRRLDRGRRTGRRKVVPVRPVLAERAEGQKAGGSSRELNVLRVLRKAGRPLPVQQHPVVVAGRTRYLDFAYPKVRIGLEFDGFAEHGLIRSTFDDDRARDAELVLAGWLILHFTSRTPRTDLISQVDRALALRGPKTS